MQKVDMKDWKKFRIGDLLQTERGRCKSVTGLPDGDIPYVGCSNVNGGVLGYYSIEDKNIIQQGHGICFIGNGNGSAGQQVYRPDGIFVCSTGNVLGYADWLNPYNAAFIIALLDKQQEVTHRFSHVNGRTKDKLDSQEILLPVTKSGGPDLAYMENYMKNIMEESESRLEHLRTADTKKKKRPSLVKSGKVKKPIRFLYVP